MNIFTYFIGSIYIVRSIFRFSNYYTKHIQTHYLPDITDIKLEKIDECLYSSIHGTLSSVCAALSLTNSNIIKGIYQTDNEMQYLTASICLSYFIIDLIRCLINQKYLFVIHHISSINLLTLTLHSYYTNQNKGFYAMYLIFLLESNTILLNIGYLLKEFKFHYSITCTSWIIHLMFFVIFRLILIPIILGIYYYNEPMNMKNLIQLPNFILILSGSVYWSYRQMIGINKYLKQNSVI
jgi:hypothetical protein